MLKPVDHAVHALARIAEIKPLATLGDAYEDAEPWIERLVRGQTYVAEVTGRLDDKTFHIAINGQPLMAALQAELTAGQSIRLKYLSAEPVPTFMLLAQDSDDSSPAKLSEAAQLIDRQLRGAREQPSSAVYEAALAVSKTPANAHQLAAELRHALTSSGLFYESHLAEFASGARSLAEVMQEAHNRDNFSAGSLLIKQLGILENQRLLWHGEIWPGQTMEWQLQAEERQADGREQNDESRPLSSSITLHLPHLGKVIARLDMAQGEMRILLSAEESATVGKLAAARPALLAALENNVQNIHALAVVQHGST